MEEIEKGKEEAGAGDGRVGRKRRTAVGLGRRARRQALRLALIGFAHEMDP